MKTEQPILITSIEAAEDLTKNLFVGFDGFKCSGASKSLGVCNAASSLGEEAPILCRGIALVTTGEAITVGSEIKVNAGKAVVVGIGPVEGYALDASLGADELIRVLLV